MLTMNMILFDAKFFLFSSVKRMNVKLESGLVSEHACQTGDAVFKQKWRLLEGAVIAVQKKEKYDTSSEELYEVQNRLFCCFNHAHKSKTVKFKS